MEHKIKQRAIVYAVIAILIVSTAAALSYRFGTYLSENESMLPPIPTPQSTLLATFQSGAELANFLHGHAATTDPFPFFGPLDVRFLPEMDVTFTFHSSEDLAVQSSGLVPQGSLDYSSTNIQVAGVDEIDLVKTDEEYLYVLSGTSLLILKAYPAETAALLVNMTFDNLFPAGIFVGGDRLVVLGSKYNIPTPYYRSNAYIIDAKTTARIYDIHNRTNPVLLRDLTLTGSYFNSRQIGDYIYFVVSQPAYIVYDTVILPKIYSNDKLVREIAPSEIHYHNGSDQYYQYTTFLAMNMQNATEAPTYMSLMLGGTSSMYVSTRNMYVTFREFYENTTICRIHLQENNMTAEAKGQVLGNTLNQFSMDEYDDYFRIATQSWKNGNPRSNLFTLNMDLDPVGALLDIEPGETLDSARFLGDRCYLSTSIAMQDPFFVINLTDPTTPKILGDLEIPGFHRYLHPYDGSHVIGLGRDEENKVKVSLFDVTDVTTPILIDEYRFEGYWSNTEALTDHHAFLFSSSKNLLAIPVEYANEHYERHQGLFVFNITLTKGFVLRGSLTHRELGIDHWDHSYNIRRVLYIEDVLYTISSRKIHLNNLETLTLIKEIPLH